MKSVVRALVVVLLVGDGLFALECFDCIGPDSAGCSLERKTTCTGHCFYSMTKGLNSSSMPNFLRGCTTTLEQSQMDGCADISLSFMGVEMTQRSCYCMEDLCNNKTINSVNQLSNKTIECYLCSGAECRSPRKVTCDGGCAIALNKGEFSKSCITNGELFGKGVAVNMKFTGCVVNKTEMVYTCHENLCNWEDQHPCLKITPGPINSRSSSVQIWPVLAFLSAIVTLVTMLQTTISYGH